MDQSVWSVLKKLATCPVKNRIGGSRLLASKHEPKENRTKRQASSRPKSSRTSNLGRMIDSSHVLYHALSHTLSLYQANRRR